MSTASVAKPRAALKVKKTNILKLLALAKAIYQAMMVLNAAMFASPVVTAVALLALITALDTAETNARLKTTGLAAIRNGKRDLLWTALESLRAQVQGMADTMSMESAKGLILAAGMMLEDVAVHDKPLLEAKLSATTSGLVFLVANASLLVGKSKKRVTFNWSWSADGGKTWSTSSTPLASTEVPNLTPGVAYQFRVSVTISKVTGVWSENPVTLVVH